MQYARDIETKWYFQYVFVCVRACVRCPSRVSSPHWLKTQESTDLEI